MTADLEKAARDRHIGWLFQAIDRSFRYLVDDFGFAVSDVCIHHEGSSATFRRDHFGVIVEYTPDSGDIRCSLTRFPDDVLSAPTSAEAWDLLAEREPETDWSPWPRNRGDRKRVEELIAQWTDGLRRLAQDVLRADAAPPGPYFQWW